LLATRLTRSLSKMWSRRCGPCARTACTACTCPHLPVRVQEHLPRNDGLAVKSMLRAGWCGQAEYATFVKSVEYTPEKRYAGVKVLFKPPQAANAGDEHKAKREVSALLLRPMVWSLQSMARG
jgi:hypothetical protein